MLKPLFLFLSFSPLADRYLSPQSLINVWPDRFGLHSDLDDCNKLTAVNRFTLGINKADKGQPASEFPATDFYAWVQICAKSGLKKMAVPSDNHAAVFSQSLWKDLSDKQRSDFVNGLIQQYLGTDQMLEDYYQGDEEHPITGREIREQMARSILDQLDEVLKASLAGHQDWLTQNYAFAFAQTTSFELNYLRARSITMQLIISLFNWRY